MVTDSLRYCSGQDDRVNAVQMTPGTVAELAGAMTPPAQP
jgi:hypothetical protein